MLSFLLLSAVCVFWLRSYVVSDSFLGYRQAATSANGRFTQQTWFVLTGSGGLGFGWTENVHPGQLRGVTSVAWPTVISDPALAGFGWYSELPQRPAAPAALKGLRLGPCQWVHDRVTWGPFRQQQATRAVVFPFWVPALLLALAAAASAGASRRLARRARLNLCPSCGYDLRASPDRCPECGEPVASAPREAGTGIGNV
jgi:hypothetical protein